MDRAYFAAGCFWGVEAAFRRLNGVTETAVGYMGGHTEQPTYEAVCAGRTGHAETVAVTYDPQRVTYADLLDVFWEGHDPTQVNRQGPDVGTQYRSAIFPTDDAQRTAAEAAIAALERTGNLHAPVATRIEAADTFWKAEDYHQQYFEKRGLRMASH